VLNKLLRAIRRIAQGMSQLSDEERQKKLIELDKTITEIRSLSPTVVGVIEKLQNVTKNMDEDIIANVQRLSLGSYLREPPKWEPSEINLTELNQQYMKLRELVKKRNELEKLLQITIK
jgi:lipoate synthase